MTVSEISRFWEKVLNVLVEEIGEPSVSDVVFGNSYVYDIRGGSVLIVGSSPFVISLMKTRYLKMIKDALKEVGGVEYEPKFFTADQVKEDEAQYHSLVESNTYFKNSVIKPEYTFDTFVVGSFNQEAAQAAKLVAANPGKMFNPLFIYSNSGLGKTHLLHAVGNYIKNVSKPGSRIIYMSAEDFVDEYVTYAKGEKGSESLKDYIASFDVLLFDDIQMLKDKVKSQEFFFSIYNKMFNLGKQIVVTSDKQPSELSGIEERLVTRFACGLTQKIQSPDQVTCVEILKTKVLQRGISLDRFDDNVLVYFASTYCHDIRELEGALNRLISLLFISVPENEKITLDVALRATQDLKGMQSALNEISEQKIINIVCDYYNISPLDIMGTSRVGQIALARHVAMYLIRTILNVPYKKIGSLFSGKDHTTVMSGIEKVENMLKTDQGLQQAIEELKKRIDV